MNILLESANRNVNLQNLYTFLESPKEERAVLILIQDTLNLDNFMFLHARCSLSGFYNY